MPLETIALIIALSLNVLQLVSKWDESQKKRYASEQEFQTILSSLKNTLRQAERNEHLLEDIKQDYYRLIKDVESKIVGELKEQKSLVNALIVKLTGDSISAVLGNRNQNNG